MATTSQISPPQISPSLDPLPSTPFALLPSGTHVTGKESLALTLSRTLHCPLIHGEMPHAAARFGSHSQSQRGLNYTSVFSRIWLTKLSQRGFLAEGSTSPEGCAGLITCYAMQKETRDAMRLALKEVGVRSVFVVMQISGETLRGRTVGAEEKELEKRILEGKMRDIEEVGEEEGDVVVVEAVRDVDWVFEEILRRLMGMGAGG